MAARKLVLAIIAIVVATVLASCGRTVVDEDYALEMRAVQTDYEYSATVKQIDGQWPNLRAKGDISSTSYGTFTGSVEFSPGNVVGLKFDPQNVWVVIDTATLTAEQIRNMPDFGDDRLVYVSTMYCDTGGNA